MDVADVHKVTLWVICLCVQFVAVNFSTIDWKLPCILYFARIDLVQQHDVTGQHVTGLFGPLISVLNWPFGGVTSSLASCRCREFLGIIGAGVVEVRCRQGYR